MRGDELNTDFDNMEMTTKEIGDLYSDTFGNLPSRTVIHDPIGAKGPKRSLKQTIFKQQEDAIRKFFKLHNEKNFSLYDARDIVRKSLDVGDWSIPVYHLPEVQILQPQKTPLAELMPRVSVQNDTVKVQVVDEGGFPSVTWGSQGNTTSTQEFDYVDDASSYSVNSFSVKYYDTGVRIQDFLTLASQPLRNAVSVEETNVMHAMRIEEEKQLIQGDGSNAGTTNDSSGWPGLVDNNSAKESADPSGWSDTDWKEKTRELISDVEKHGGNRDNMVVVVPFDAYNDLANALDDFARYDLTTADELDFGFTTLAFENVPIMKSHGFSSSVGSQSSNDPFMIAVDLETSWLGTLRDTTLQPVPKQGPQELVAVDAYTANVAQAPKRIQWYKFS